MSIELKEGQQAAYEAFCSFIMDPDDKLFVLKGYSGTGKSTLVKTIIERLPKLFKTMRLINPDADYGYSLWLTATTSKAAENLQHITGLPVTTVHSACGLMLQKDHLSGKAHLVRKRNFRPLESALLFVDEASYIDAKLLGQIIESVDENSKIMFIGDPAQLLAVRAWDAPAFTKGFTEASLTEVVRQAEGNPILELATALRNTVNGAPFPSFKPDGVHIRHMDRSTFEDEIVKEFSDPDWHFHQSKVLVYTNATAIAYNNEIRNVVKGNAKFEVGDYAVSNAYVSSGTHNVANNQMVFISHIENNVNHLEVPGRIFTLDCNGRFFMPDSPGDKKKRLKEARDLGNYVDAKDIDSWIDLRAVYASTTNKAQGSTYDKVFIDLDDMKKCRNPNQLARMLYVAVSRARYRVDFTGDLV